MVGQIPEDAILEYQAGTTLVYPTNTTGLLADSGQHAVPNAAIIPAAILELADRVEAQDFSADLFQTLY